MSIGERIIKGVGAQGFNWVSIVGVRLLELPILLHFWGAERYGEWLILFAIPSLLSMTDFGFAGTAKREMAMLTSAEKIDEASGVYHTITIFMAGISAAIITVAAIFLFFIFDPVWLNLNSQDPSFYKVSILLLLVYIAVKMQTGMLEAGLYSTGKYARGVVYMAAIRLIEFVAFITVVFFGGGIVSASLAFLLISILAYFILTLILVTKIDWIRPRLQFRTKVIKKLGRPAIAALGFPLGAMMNIQGIRLIVGTVLGPAALTTFVAMRTLSAVGMRIADMLSLVMEPEYAYAKGKNDIASLRRLACVSSQLAFWIGLVLSVFLLVAGEELIKLWTQGKIIMEYEVFMILVVAGFINTIWFNILKVPYAINRHERVALIFVILSSLVLFLVALLASNYGMYGVAGSIMAGEILLALSIIPLSLKYVNINVSDWFMKVITPPFWLIAFMKKRG